ncbi:MAG: hypothetical protein ABI317_08730 [Gaiellales bacterium]
MKVLALYGIHGNIDALEAVLGDRRSANPDVILVGATSYRARSLARRSPSSPR